MENLRRRTVRVLLPLPLADAYDYSVPEGLEVAAGHFVIVPLGKRETVGVVWGEGSGEVAPEKLRDIVDVLPALPMADPLRRFVDWVSAYTLAPPGAVLRMAMSVPSALEAPKTEIVYRAAASRDDDGAEAHRRAPARARAAEGRPGHAGRGAGAYRRRRHVGDQDHGLDRPAGRRRAHDAPLLRAARRQAQGPALSPEQAVAAQGLVDKVLAHAFSATLLDGVPGAGKTEVYFEAIAAALAAGRQVLVLLPEIALTAQWLERFEDRFGAPPAAWHSGLTSLERRETWRAIAEGRVGVVVGARSALFLPFADLGLIVVDEEHDASFKQEDGVTYHARDMAVVRARLVAAPIVLASATPSLESVVNVAAGRYGALHLPDRHGGRELAELSAVDLRREPPARGRWLSPPVRRGDDARRWRPASRRCCSSIAAAMRRSRSAAPAATASNARNARPGWSSIAFAARWSAITAATPSRRRMPASLAAPSTSSSPAGRASSAWRRRRWSCFPRRGWSSSPPTRLMNRDEAAAAIDRMVDGRDRHPDRHPDGGQGPSLSRT